MTGPTHAEEVSRGILTCILAASASREAATLVQQAFMNDRFRVYISPDIIGAELGGCFKNIIALAAGICDGVGLGDNSKAALMTRGLTEIARLGTALGGRSETFAGLSGMGDLIVTCTSMHSRNRRAGIKIGQGMDVQQAMKEIGAVVEGYYATEAGYMLAQKVGAQERNRRNLEVSEKRKRRESRNASLAVFCVRKMSMKKALYFHRELYQPFYIN